MQTNICTFVLTSVAYEGIPNVPSTRASLDLLEFFLLVGRGDGWGETESRIQNRNHFRNHENDSNLFLLDKVDTF